MNADNLRFYEPGAKVPKEACKDFNNGRFKGTDINRMWRVRKLTEMFGPVGIGWTFNLIETWERRIDSSNAVAIFAKGELKVRDPATGEWSEPIVGYGGNYIVQSNQYGDRINDEAFKMISTDALGHACSYLGIGESVYWNESTKYTSQNEGEAKPKGTTKIPSVTPKADPFFGRPTAKADTSVHPIAPTESSAKADPVKKKSDLDTILDAEVDPKLKGMVLEWKRGNNVLSLYETTPEQRSQLANMVRSVA